MEANINPLIGMSTRETIENAAETLSAAVVLMTGKHSGLSQLLMPVLNVLERDDVAGDADAIDGAAEAFSAAIVLMADGHSDLCRLLMPVLLAVEHVAGGAPQGVGEALPVAAEANPIAEYNRRAAQDRAECNA